MTAKVFSRPHARDKSSARRHEGNVRDRDVGRCLLDQREESVRVWPNKKPDEKRGDQRVPASPEWVS
jgi:hypothetical protein